MKKLDVGVQKPSEFNREVTVGEYTFMLPEPPKDYKEILNWDLKKEEQKWTRPDLPSDRVFESWDQKKQVDFLVTEFKRRREGCFFYNDGKIEYLTGHHYFFLSYWKLPEGYPYWKDSDGEFFQIYDYTEKLENCFGLLHLTNRRDGKTAKSMAILYNSVTLYRESHGGIQSKTNKDGKDIFKKIVRSWQKLPNYMKPVDSGDTNPSNELKFEEPSKRSTKGVKKQYKEVLNSLIDYRSATEEAYDGTKLKFYYQDEVGKTIESNIYERWLIAKECLTVGRTVVGKTLATSTVEDMEDKGGENCYILWEESDLEKGIESGRDMTNSGLLRHFKPATKGLLGFIDEYGRSVIEDPEKPVMGIDGKLIKEGSKTYLDNRRIGLRGTALASEKRKYPQNVDEAFYQDGKLTPFDIVKLNEQLEYNRDLPNNIVTRGNFVWSSESGKQVEFRHSENGRWNVVWFPEMEDRNSTIIVNGRVRPGNYNYMSSGVDPFDHKTTSDNRRSNAASYVYRKFDPMNPSNSDMFVSEYVCRPPYPEDLYEDMAKQSVFYGTELLCENNKIGLIRWFENNGFYNYLMERPMETHTEWSKNRQKEKGIPFNSEAVRSAAIEIMETYVYSNVGMDYAENKMGKLYFDSLINCLIKFNPQKWTDYDEFVGAVLALMGTRRYKTANTNNSSLSVGSVVKMYKKRR